MRHSVLFLSLGIALEVLRVSVTIGSAVILERLNQDQRKAVFNRVVDRSVTEIRSRISDYETALRAGAGLYDASKSVERGEWKAFVQALNIEQNFPGSNGFGHIIRIRPGEMEGFLKTEREDEYPQFEVKTIGPIQEERFIVNKIAPLEPNVDVVGLEISGEERRRETAIAAMTSGKARITRIISLVQERMKKPGFLIMAPHYSTRNIPATEAERVATCIGWTYAPFVGEYVLDDFILSQPEGVSLSIYEESVQPENVIAIGGRKTSGDLTSQQQLTVAGQKWICVAHSTAEFRVASTTLATWMVLAIGFSTSTGLLVVLLLLHRSSERALRRAAVATEEARQAGESKTRFLAVMSHEIRTPLNGVIGMADLALHEDMSAVVREQVSTIHSSGHTLLALVNDILDFSRFTTGNVPLESIPFDASREVDAVVKL